MGAFDYIENNLITLRKQLEKICVNCGRDSKEIRLIAVSKTFPAEAVVSAIETGQADFGENKVQEMVSKHEALDTGNINWHLIGHLQTNKVKYIVPFVYLIHSVDSLELAQEINKRASGTGRIVNCLIQVNTSYEEQKSGCEPGDALKLVKEISQFQNVKIEGLMTISKMMIDEKDENERKEVRGNFRKLKSLFDEIASQKIPNVDMKYLSMGMTSDYDIAIEEGSNMLRIGTAIFGKRK